MKSHRVLIGFSVLLLSICSGVAALVVGDRLHTLYPTPETESALLKNYTPQRVIEQFQCKQSSAHAGPVGGGAAGDKFVTRNGGFEWWFVMRSDKWTPLYDRP
jgi:hypothetical protein